MPRSFHVRFSTKGQSVDARLHIDAATDPVLATARAHRKSRYGCSQCKAQKVKCDETYPRCVRCRRRGISCTIVSRPSRWRREHCVETPLSIPPLIPPSTPSLRIDTTLLQWWLDSTCKILVLDSDSNPLQLPLLEHLAISPALCCAVESFSAGHRGNWAHQARVAFLQKRISALALCRAELNSRAVPLETSFFTVLLIGLPTPFIEDIDNYGKEHLIAASTILNTLFEQNKSQPAPRLDQLLAYYTWWDMSCAFSLDPHELPPLSTSKVLATIDTESRLFDSRFAGCLPELYHLLGLLLRYCMHLLRGGPCDQEHEQTFERALTHWEPRQARREQLILAEAFRKHGLIVFYRVCRIQASNGKDTALASLIHEYATTIIDLVLPSQVGTAFWNSLAVPLLTAGAEMTADDYKLRDTVREAFQAVLSQCRTNVVVRVRDLLEETWALHDAGHDLSYLEVMIQKGWNFSFV